jgi:hypothetical protein
MPQSDRLRLLAGCHGVLRHHGIDSPAAYRSVSREQLARLHKFGPTIRHLVDRGPPTSWRLCGRRATSPGWSR